MVWKDQKVIPQLQKHIKHHKAKLAPAESEKPGPVQAKKFIATLQKPLQSRNLVHSPSYRGKTYTHGRNPMRGGATTPGDNINYSVVV